MCVHVRLVTCLRCEKEYEIRLGVSAACLVLGSASPVGNLWVSGIGSSVSSVSCGAGFV
jgi:hypothetical protein